MKKASVIFTLSLISVHMLFVSAIWGWDDTITHKSLTEQAVLKSVLSPSRGDKLTQFGLADIDQILHWEGQACDDDTKKTDCSIKQWLKYGAEKEDGKKYFPIRPLNHFHNPITDEGLSNYVPRTQLSALVWAQDFNAQIEKGGPEGDQSWSTLRNLFYIALTYDDGEDGSDECVREETYAQLFKGLGHQMHLVQDMAVPYHVRNDAHLRDSMQGKPWLRFLVPRSMLYFETWAKKHTLDIDRFASAAGTDDFPDLPFDTPYPGVESPISQLWDANVYIRSSIPSNTNEQGLAEYTNSNFFSEGTRFAGENGSQDLPYPKRSSLEPFIDTDGRFNKVYLAKKGDGESITHFVRAPYVYFLTYPDIPNYSYYLDENCHKDYAEKLVPRAVGYSAALLNYFFRGTIELCSVVDDQGDIAGYSIENKTEHEPMEGTFEIYYDHIDGDRIQIWSGFLSLGPKDSDTSKSDPFDLDHPEPGEAKEPGKYILVFRGQLGHEQNAVAGRISVLNPSEFVYVNIGARCIIWDIAKNDYASIADSDGNPIDFPCDQFFVRDWLDDHPAGWVAEIPWYYTPFVNENRPTWDDTNVEFASCIQNRLCNGYDTGTTNVTDICYPTKGLSGPEDCIYYYKTASCCNDGGAIIYTCDPSRPFIPWNTTDFYRSRQYRMMYQAYVPEASGSGIRTLFGSYVGSYRGHEGIITTLWDKRNQSEHSGFKEITWACEYPYSETDLTASYKESWYDHYKFTTFLGNLGEITVTSQKASQTTSTQSDPQTTYSTWDVKLLDGENPNIYKLGLVSEKTVLFIFLYQYRLRIKPQPISGQVMEDSFSKPELFVQAAAKTVGDTSTIDPFKVSKNSAFTEAIRELIDNFYEANDADEKEILNITDQIYVSINSQVVRQ